MEACRCCISRSYWKGRSLNIVFKIQVKKQWFAQLKHSLQHSGKNTQWFVYIKRCANVLVILRKSYIRLPDCSDEMAWEKYTKGKLSTAHESSVFQPTTRDPNRFSLGSGHGSSHLRQTQATKNRNTPGANPNPMGNFPIPLQMKRTPATPVIL